MSYKLRAVIVGINEYNDVRYRRTSSLRFAQNDALEISKVLRASTAFRLEAKSPYLLMNAQATERTVRTAIERLFAERSFDQQTINLFYFAGHGVYMDKNDLTYLCCYGVDFAEPEYGGIRLNDIYNWLNTSTAECVIAIIDACFSGGLVVGPKIDHLSAAERAKQAIEVLRGPDGKTIALLAACRSDQEARESRKYQHGIFTYQLLRGLREGYAQDNDGTVRLTGLVNYMQRSFENDLQKPASSIRGSASIALWHMPRPAPAPETPAPQPALLPVIPPKQLGQPTLAQPYTSTVALPPMSPVQSSPAPLHGNLVAPPPLELPPARGDLSQLQAVLPQHPDAPKRISALSGDLSQLRATLPQHPDDPKRTTSSLGDVDVPAGLPPIWQPKPSLPPQLSQAIVISLVILVLLVGIIWLFHH